MYTSGLRYGFFVLFLSFSLTRTAFAQLEGRLYLDKVEYRLGEPVYLHFDLTNTGTAPMQVVIGDSYSSCGGYRIEVSNKPTFDTSTCVSPSYGCPIGAWTIGPGEVRHDKVLLNYVHDLSTPGLYDIRASRTLTFGPPADFVSQISGPQLKAEEQFHIRVNDEGSQDLLSMFQPFLEALDSKDEEHQQEAARVIGSLAPPFLEAKILDMAGSPKTRRFALLGLRRLNTTRSRKALADVVLGTPGYSYEKEQAIKYLSEMGDKTYFPLLLDEARKHEPNQARDYTLAAAQLGGEDAMPYVSSLLADSDPFSRANGVMALPQTGSRHAVPLLIELLRSPDLSVGRLASIGLIHLTHRSPFSAGHWFSDAPSNEYSDWMRWWMRERDRATIYRPDQCGKIDPLK